VLETDEARQVWNLVLRCANQLRLVQGAVAGFDFTAILMMGRATGVNLTALAEWLPAIEARAVNAMNKRMKDQGNG
jgi:hypothetical protein